MNVTYFREIANRLFRVSEGFGAVFERGFKGEWRFKENNLRCDFVFVGLFF